MDQFEYSYKCTIELIGNYENALSEYFNKDNFYLWQDSLKEIILGENDNEYTLVYEYDIYKLKIKTTILEYLPPSYAKSIYEANDVWNLCIDNFEKLSDDKILWTMDVIFRFNAEPSFSIETLVEKTLSEMRVFKHYFENK